MTHVHEEAPGADRLQPAPPSHGLVQKGGILGQRRVGIPGHALPHAPLEHERAPVHVPDEQAAVQLRIAHPELPRRQVEHHRIAQRRDVRPSLDDGRRLPGEALRPVPVVVVDDQLHVGIVLGEEVSSGLGGEVGAIPGRHQGAHQRPLGT